VAVAVAVLEGITAVLPSRTRSRADVRRALHLGLFNRLVGIGADVCLDVGMEEIVDIEIGIDVNIEETALLVDLEGIDFPVSLFEVGGIVGHVVVAGACLGGAGTRGPCVAGPVAAEGDIEDDLQLVEVRVDVTVAAESGGWKTPE